MRAALAGDGKAYRSFLTTVVPYMRSVARGRCGSMGIGEADAEDIVQEALLAIHLKRGTWDSSRPIGPWIAVIVRNKLIDAFRRHGRRIVVPIEEVMETLGVEVRQEPHLTSDEMEGLFARLRTKQREIVRSISIEGISIRETALRLDMSEGAVRVALHRALQALAALYRSRT
jgi:RNA polymerase sigma-70 factor (ECF subfamily)